jgi:hypothetical protein
LWPSSDDSEAIGHGFGGRSMSWWIFCCELCVKKYGTWYVLSQKRGCSRSSLFLTAH